MDFIISSYEVARFSIVGREYPLTNIKKLKNDIELSFFSDCLGLDLYEEMIENSKEISYANVLEWKDTTTYSTGNKCFFFDTVYQSKVDSNTNKKPGHDVAEDYWKLANKFTNEDFQTLYETYLRDLLANLIVKEVLALDSIQMGGKGITMAAAPDQHGNITADVKTIEYQLRRIQTIIDRKTELMNRYLVSQYKLFLSDNSTGYDWSIVPFVKDECEKCETPNKKGIRRILFRSS